MKIVACLSSISVLLLLSACNRNSDTSAGGTSDSRSISTDTANGTAGSNDLGANVTHTPSRSEVAEPANNTGKNVRDRSGDSITPGDQGENQSDLDLTKKIRRAITSNDQLSSEAKNIKIMTANGKVTLRGPVNTEQEKKSIESIAQQEGGTSVDNQLEVKTSNQ